MPGGPAGSPESIGPIGPMDDWALFRGLSGSSEVEIVVSDPALADAVSRAAAQSRDATPHRLVIRTPKTSDPSRPRVAVGSLDEAWIRDLVDRLGYLREPETGDPYFVVHGAGYRRADETLIATGPDPDRPGLPLTVHVAGIGGADVLAAELNHVVPGWRSGIVVRRAGALALEFPLLEDGSPDWARRMNYVHRRQEGGPVTYRSFGGLTLQIPEGLSTEGAENYGQLLFQVRQRVLRTLAPGSPVDRLDVRLVGDVEELQWLYGDGGLSRVYASSPNKVLALLSGEVPNDGGRCAAQATAIQLFGPPSDPWLLDGVGTAFAETWWGWPWVEWVSYLHDAGLTPSVEELVRPDAELKRSPHVLVPLRGALFGHLLATLGREEVARLWRGEFELGFGEELERGFRERLDIGVSALGEQLRIHRDARREELRSKSWHGGLHVGPGRGDLTQAYIRRDLGQSLDRAHEIGSRAIALSPFVYAEPRGLRSAGAALPSWPDVDPGDVALAAAVGASRRRGMGVMLTPLFLATSHGTWADARTLGGEGEIDDFFSEFGRAIEHYALLGELLGIDLLCLGNEYALASATSPVDDDEVNDAAQEKREHLQALWVELIADTRRISSALLTYGAGPSHEMRRIGFWNELDFVGVDFYPTLSRPSSEQASVRTREQMDELLGDCLEVASAVDRPLLLVQAGFPAHDRASDRPRLSSGSIDLAVQKRLYEVLGEAMVGPRTAGRLAGVFFWRWDPNPDAGGPDDPGHTPQGKPAEQALRALFAR